MILTYYPQTKRELAVQLGCSPREVEAIIHDARMTGTPIISDSRGYWLTDDPEEVAACAKRLRSRYITQARTARALRLTSRRMARPVLFPDLT
jgi:biotin operon repressor